MISFPNFRAIAGMACAATLVMIINLNMNSKDRKDNAQTTGEIIYLDNHLDSAAFQTTCNCRYLKLQGYPHPFKIFLDKDGDSFRPTYEQVDNLKTGDIVTVFYFENTYAQREEMRYVAFIDKDGVPFFEVGDSKRPAALVIIGLSSVLIVAAFVMWRLKKIGF
jgi:hypothetical protein